MGPARFTGGGGRRGAVTLVLVVRQMPEEKGSRRIPAPDFIQGCQGPSAGISFFPSRARPHRFQRRDAFFEAATARHPPPHSGWELIRC